MRIAPQVELDTDQRSRLEAIVRSRKLPARLIERSRIVLLAAAGCRNKQITAELNLTPEKAARWRKRYLQLGLAGLEKDAPRPGRKPRITAYLKNHGTLETAQHIANHEFPRTTMLYDRRQEEISLDEVERIAI